MWFKITEVVQKTSESSSPEKQLLPFIHFFYLTLLSQSKNSNWGGGWVSWESTIQYLSSLTQKKTIGKKGISDILSIFYAESHRALIPGSLNCSYGLLVRGGLMGQVKYGFLAPTSYIRYSRYKDPVCVYLLGTLMHN